MIIIDLLKDLNINSMPDCKGIIIDDIKNIKIFWELNIYPYQNPLAIKIKFSFNETIPYHSPEITNLFDIRHFYNGDLFKWMSLNVEYICYLIINYKIPNYYYNYNY